MPAKLNTAQPVVQAWQTVHTASDAVELREWWKGLESPDLNAWVAKARAHNKEIKAAEANLKAARAILSLAKTATQPAGSIDASAQRLRQAGGAQPPGTVGSSPFSDQTLADVGFGLGWELDLSGRFKGLRNVAKANVEDAIWRRRQVEAAVTAETVHAWLSWRTASMETVLVEQRLSALEEIHNSRSKAYSTGATSIDEVEQAEIAVKSLRAELPELKASTRRAARRLAVLTGEVPQETILSDETVAVNDGWSAPSALPAQDPNQTLRFRPDVGMAEAQLLAASARTVVSRADLYPRISLIGSAGLTNAPGDIGEDNSLRFSVGPQLTWGLFNYNRTRAQIKASDAQAEAAYSIWHQTTLAALEEAENAIDAWVASAQSEQHVSQALEGSRVLSLQTLQRFKRGLVSRVELLGSEENRLEAERRAVNAHLQTALSWSRACLALGGGWSSDQVAPTAP
jgi:NodT family efflux transporter outer membrane factor (OMF) lipoprotein